ncbi:hypothetical protein B0O80DRAFT_430243 [Mortierella sp. GBAus27b]|nr:hypothetical protein BGX31_005186 [Mortierella sp. GBA43]KAI8347392.1 hypothetical protein B0O80DRAFT_430243 [Mortierella sp. GBAus27b]
MAPSCVVDPMDCIFEKRSVPVLHKRAPPATGETKSNNQAVVIGAVVGSLVLVAALALFAYCMRKRRASRRIGQLQKFLPTFMDQEKTEKYFQKHGSSTTLVGTGAPDAKEPSQPTNAHQRTRSVPVAFAKGVTDHRNRHVERDGSIGQFQQISLTTDDAVLQREDSLKRSLSVRSTRARSATVTAPPPAVSSLHRGVSLNKHTPQGSSGRSDLVDEEGEQHDKFAEGESLVAPNRLSVLLDFDKVKKNNNRFSAMSVIEDDPNFDPSRFSTGSVMFDAKRLSQLSTASADDDDRSSTEDFRSALPPHQQQHSFHSHHNSPLTHSREVSLDATPMPPVSQPSYVGGDKQELDDDDDVVLQPTVHAPMGFQGHPGQGFYPPMPQNMPMQMPTQVPMQMPIPVHMQMYNSPVPGSASPPIPKRPLVHAQEHMSVSPPHGGQ